MPPETPSLFLQVLERFGFPVFVSCVLGAAIWFMVRPLITEIGRLTRSITLLILTQQFAPQFHEAAKELYDESLDAARKRKEDLSHERQIPKT